MRHQGQVRVGSCRYEGSKRIDPTYPGFTPIVCLTASTKYGMLGPYCIKVPMRFPLDPNTYMCLMENCWQFSKSYMEVPSAIERRSRFDQTIIWQWPAQKHSEFYYEDENGVPDPTCKPENRKWRILPAYLEWRKAGMLSQDPIRYPVGRRNMDQCLCSFKSNPDGSVDPTALNYVESRKQIYLPLYVAGVKQHPEFHKLKERLSRGENLLIIEVDACKEDSIDYYMATYGVPRNFIEHGTMLVTPENLNIMLNDTKERFGHGYCLAGALLNLY